MGGCWNACLYVLNDVISVQYRGKRKIKETSTEKQKVITREDNFFCIVFPPYSFFIVPRRIKTLSPIKMTNISTETAEETPIS